MKYLKIDNNRGYFRLDPIDPNNEHWIELDKISKDDLLSLLASASNDSFEIDPYVDDAIKNPAHNIIYKNIYNKFSEFLENRSRFRDSIESTYKTALDKYKMSES